MNLATIARKFDKDLESIEARQLVYGKLNIDQLDTLEIATAIYAVADYILDTLDPRDTHNIELFREVRDRAEKHAREMHNKLNTTLRALPEPKRQIPETPQPTGRLSQKQIETEANGGQRNTQTRYSDAVRQEIIQLYEQGTPITEIAQAYSIPYRSVWGLVHRK